jgi:hypothetical protein
LVAFAIGPMLAAAARAGRVAYLATGAKGNYSDLSSGGASNGDKGTLQLSNLVALEKELKNIGPEFLREFKRDSKRVGKPAVTAVRKSFRDVGDRGPLGGPRSKPGRTGRTFDRMYTQNGRISWTAARKVGGRSGIDVNYKNRKEGKALSDLKAAKDGTVSIVRVRVRAPAFVVADMAGKSNSATKSGGLTRRYKINAFGKGVIERKHTINPWNVNNWINSLNSGAKGGAGKPSRYAYPAIQKHTPKFKADMQVVLRGAVAKINRRLES